VSDSSLSSASFYADFSALSALKKDVKASDPQAIRAAARQFESLFTDMMLKAMREAKLLASTQLCWLTWDALMSGRPWLEGLVANTCAERPNIPGYGEGLIKQHGWFGWERHRWGKLFNLSGDDLEFFELHSEADVAHSNLGWQTVAEQAERLGVADQVVHACRLNLYVWESYLNGIADGGDALDRGERPAYV